MATKRKKRPTAKLRKPKTLDQLEDQADARGDGVASSAGPQARKPAGLDKPRGGGTSARPYERSDGTKTRSTTVHLPVELHRRLRQHCAATERRMSAVISGVLAEHLDVIDDMAKEDARRQRLLDQ